MSPDRKHTIILIPGLSDNEPISRLFLEQATSKWENSNLTVLFHSVLWRDGEAFEPKLLRLLSRIDSISKENKISLVGTSAGASLAFNAFAERTNTVHKAVNVCGRLRAGQHRIRSLDRMAKTSPAFHQSVAAFEKNKLKLSNKDRQRLMTIRPFFGDELVPHDTSYLEGAENHWIYTPEHMLSIYLSLRFTTPIIKFLSS